MDELIQWLEGQLAKDAHRCELWHDYECDLLAQETEGGLRSAAAALEMMAAVPGAVCSCGVPARALREIECKRRVLTEYVKEARVMERGHRTGWTEGGQAVRKHLIKAWALAFEHRPGYRPEWRP
ncbi:DUF6221 family protein [Streptomyces sp. CC224B]|uniref:DUF6221 family protein n=1 Tax=Streptomyces sp. CC224B TaxID=3044571 RepID=UPI0024A86C33|nr:DUF6221 family protein [Streptomyces sp. CC224B]